MLSSKDTHRRRNRKQRIKNAATSAATSLTQLKKLEKSMPYHINWEAASGTK